MNCINCNQKLDSTDGFIVCPACHTVNTTARTVETNPITQKPKILAQFQNFRSKKLLAFSASLVVILLLAGILGLQNYQASSNLKAARTSMQEGDFIKAAELLNRAGSYFSLRSTNKQISEAKSQNNLWLDYSGKLEEAKRLVEQSELEKAGEILRLIGEDFPLYSQVEDLLATIQVQISDKPVAKAKKTKPSVKKQPSPPAAFVSPSVQKPCNQISGLTSRSSIDRPDDISGYQVHIVYAIPSDRPDNKYDINGRIASSVSAWQNWLCNQTGGKKMRLDTYKGRLDVSFVKFKSSDKTIKTGSELPYSTNPQFNPYVKEDIEIRLKNLGLIDPNKIYAVYYGGSSNYSCGGAAWPPTIKGQVGAMYMHGGSSSWNVKCDDNKLTASYTNPAYFEFGMLHEIIHTLGLVPSCAPNHVLSGHSSDSPTDLMYSGSKAWRPSVLDVNRNDYYKHGRSNCLDLNKSVFLTSGGSQIPPGW